MKKLFAVLTCVFVASSVYGLTNSTLIDFGITGVAANLQTENTATNLGVSLEQNLFNDNWIVWLNESVSLPENRRYSYVTNADSKGNNGQWEAGKVLGVRVHFPVQAWNSFAMVKPPFEIEMYAGENGGLYAGGKGVIHNVGTIKSITSWVYGRNFLIAYFVNLKNQNSEFTQYPMGNLYFSGWRQLKWDNLNYLADVRDRVLIREPLYPTMMPSVKLDSLQFYRTKDTLGGDFIGYVKDVKVEHDIAVVEVDEDINDEATWQIIKTENEKRQAIEAARIREALELKALEERRTGAADNAAANQDAAAQQ